MDKYFLNDTEVKSLRTREDLEEYLNFIKKDDMIVEPYINECAAVGMENTPLFFDQFKEENKISSDPELISECCNSYGIFLIFPAKNKMNCLPTRYTAYSGICQRAGLAGLSMTNTEEKNNCSPLSPERRAAFLSECMKLYKDPAKILIREGKVGAMHSKQYGFLLPYDIFPIIEEKFKENWPDMEYVSGQVSHEVLMADYALNDPLAEQNMKATLEALGADIKSLKAMIKISTSDVGLSALRFSVMYVINGSLVRIGKPVEMVHNAGNTVEKLESTYLPLVGAMLQEAEDAIETLGNIDIEYPAGCLQHVCLSHRAVPYQGVKVALDEMLLLYPGGCKAIDVYFKVNEIAENEYKKGKMGLNTYMTMVENVAKLMYLNYKQYDLPVSDK